MKYKLLKRSCLFLLLLFLMLFTSYATCYAAGAKTYDIGKQNAVISKSGEYVITGSTDKYTIQVKKGVKANITFKNVSIVNWDGEDRNARKSIDVMDIQSGAEVNLTLVGENNLTNSWLYAAIHVPYGAKLTITDKSTGSLSAVAYGGGAGIGGSESDRNGGTGTIVINGGTVYARGGYSNCGIGGGAIDRFAYDVYPTYYLGGGDITINGGKVTAVGGGAGGIDDEGAAGIGGASLTRQGKITINGGEITASSFGAGIGGESKRGKGNIITITGGIITANGNNYGSGIGNSLNPAGTIINISGGTIYAKGDHGNKTVYESYFPDTEQFLNSMKAYDIAAEKTVITGGNILAYTFSTRPVEAQGKEAVQIFLNCSKGKITDIQVSGRKYGAKDIISNGYLSLFLPAGYLKLTVKSGTIPVLSDEFLHSGEQYKAVENIDATLNLEVDLSKGDLELVDGGCIYNNKVYRTDNIVVSGTAAGHKIIAHADDDLRQRIIFRELTIDYLPPGQQDFLLVDNDVTLDICLLGENIFKLGESCRGIFVGNNATLCFLGDEKFDSLRFETGEKSKAIYTNIGNVIVYGGYLDFKLGTSSSAVYTGNYGTFTLCGGRFEAKGGGDNSCISGLYNMKVFIYGGSLIADTVGSFETSNEEITNQNYFVMTGGSVDVAGRIIFADYKIYGGSLKTRILGCGTGCKFTMYGGSLDIGAYINHREGEIELDVNNENILGGTINQRNDVPEEELDRLRIYTS